MNKRVLCILLAAALLCVPALASGTHEVSVTFDSAMGSVELQTSSGAAGDNIYFYVKPALMYEPANPAISTAAGLAVQCYAAGVEGGAYVYYFSMPDDAVTINVTFIPAEGPFDDVAATDWFCDEVLAAYEACLLYTSTR